MRFPMPVPILQQYRRDTLWIETLALPGSQRRIGISWLSIPVVQQIYKAFTTGTKYNIRLMSLMGGQLGCPNVALTGWMQ